MPVLGADNMNKILLTKKELNRLKRYPTGNTISTESRLYYYKDNKLIKKFFRRENKNLDKKIKTIDDINNSEISNIDELVIPKELVIVQGENIGFTIKEITNSTTLSSILDNPKIDLEKKVELLKKVGKLLQKTMSSKKEFYINDLQPYNILVDENNNIKLIDLDSSATTSKDPLISYYMTLDKKAEYIDKYHINEDGTSYPDYNSDLLCYNYMILNTISNNRIHRLDFDDYYNYLYYLESIGMNKDLINSFTTLYENKDNINPVEYLSNIDREPLYRSSYNIYKLTKKR